MTFYREGRRRVGVSPPDSRYVIDVRAAYEFGRSIHQLSPAPRLAEALFPDDLVQFLANGPESEEGLRVAMRAVHALTESYGASALKGPELPRDIYRGPGSLRGGFAPPGPLAFDLGEVEAAPPVVRPGKVIGIGLNYRDHAEETGRPPPKRPMFFNKFASSLIGVGQPIIHPGDAVTTQIDFEGELAVVIGRTGRFIPREDAMEYVFGYTIMNDVSARDLQYSDGQFVRGKALDTFGPIGPWIVPKSLIPDPHDLRVRTYVNGELMQDGHTGDMIFSVAELVAALSELMVLEPGDVMMTGTPAGVGAARTPPKFLQVGDEVDIQIDGIGNLVNRVEAPFAAT